MFDGPAQDDYERLRPLYYRVSFIIYLCFDLTYPQSLENIKTKWYPEAKKSVLKENHTKFVLLGTKHDLKQYLYDHLILLNGFIRIYAQYYIISEIKDIILKYEYDKHKHPEIRDESSKIPILEINKVKSECECVEFIETSSKDNFNVKEMFMLGADIYFENQKHRNTDRACCNLL